MTRLHSLTLVATLVGLSVVAPAYGDEPAASSTGKKFELDDGNPFPTFAVKVNKPVKKAWLKIRARCKAGDDIQNGSTGELLTDMEKGDSTTRRVVFSSITVKSAAAATCEFKFVIKPEPDVEEDAGTLCWKSGKFSAGSCSF